MHKKLSKCSLVMLMFLQVGLNINAQKQGEKPNVLFISVDDLNDWIGVAKGHPQAHTPNLDRLAERGMYFSNAHCTSVACTPSRLSVISGLSPVTTGCYTNGSGTPNQEIWNNVPLLPAYFRNNGYHSMACGKIEGHSGMHIALDFPHQKMYDERRLRKFCLSERVMKDAAGYAAPDFLPFPMGGSQIKKHDKNLRGHSLCAGPIDRDYLPEGKMPDEINVEWAIQRLKRDYDKPFFLGVGFLRPHVPYTAPREFFDMYPLDKIEIPEVPADEMKDIPLYGKAMAYGVMGAADEELVRVVGKDYRKELVQGYLACVSFMDAQLGKLLDALDNSEYAVNTIIVLWSDHGQSLGEKRNWRKQSLWNEATLSPMLWVVPGVTKAGEINNQPVSLMDIYPTLNQLCGLKALEILEGESLVSQLQDVNTKRKVPAVMSWSYGSHSVVDAEWRYTRYQDGTEELYNQQNDFAEHHNLAKDPKYKKVVSRLKKYLPEDKYKPSEKNKEFNLYQQRVKQWSEDPASLPEWLR